MYNVFNSSYVKLNLFPPAIRICGLAVGALQHREPAYMWPYIDTKLSVRTWWGPESSQCILAIGRFWIK